MRLPFNRVIRTVGSDVALLKSAGPNGAEVVIGGTMTSIPVFHRVEELSLALRTLSIRTTRGLTVNGVPVNVTSTCQVKLAGWGRASETHVLHASAKPATPEPSKRRSVGGGNGLSTGGEASGAGPSAGGGTDELHHDRAALWLAAQHFVGKTDEQIKAALSGTIEGHQRAIIATLTMEQLFFDRVAFCARVRSVCAEDLRGLGVALVSYVVTEIGDDCGYIEALGVTNTERAKREADEGRAEQQAQARVRVAAKDAEARRHENKQAGLKLQSDAQRRAAALQAGIEVDRREAVKDKARDIAMAEQDAVLFVAQQRARAAETEAELDVLRQQVKRERLRKEKAVHVDADALLYKAKVDADATRKQAEAEAARVRLMGNADAAAARAQGMADVDVLRERNLIWQQTENYGSLLEQWIDVMPKVGAAIAEPLRDAKKVFVSGGGSGLF